MKLVVVDRLPIENKRKKRTQKNDIHSLLDEFMRMDVKMVRVEHGSHEYKCPCAFNSSVRIAIQRYGYRIKVITIDSQNYLIRTDM